MDTYSVSKWLAPLLYKNFSFYMPYKMRTAIDHFFSPYTILSVAAVILVTLVLNLVLRSLIRIPAKLDSRRGVRYVLIIQNVISIVLFIIAFIVIFLILEIDIRPLLASAGIIGIAIGIGARSMFEDIIAGYFLLTQANLAIGDYVNISGNLGVIENMGMRSLSMVGDDGALHIIANREVKQVINYSRGDAVLDIDVPVKADQKIDTIIKTLEEVLEEMMRDNCEDYIVEKSSKVLGIQNIAAGSSLVLRVRLVTPARHREKTDKHFRLQVVKLFEKKKINLA